MKWRRSRWLVFATVLLSSLLCTLALIAQPTSSREPKIDSVDPPNWWVGFKKKDVMLLISGKNLEGATIAVDYPGVSVNRAEVHGDYLFVWLTLGPETQPGKLPLKIKTTSGTASTMFELLPRKADGKAFQGISPDDVIYMIMPDRFAIPKAGNETHSLETEFVNRCDPHAWHGGKIMGIKEQLGYLRKLGVTALWISPIYANESSAAIQYKPYHGYHATDFYKVDRHLGSLEDFQQLVAAAHKSGIKIILDVVANHTGPLHPWVANPPTPDWFHGSVDSHAEARGPVDPTADIHASVEFSRQYHDLLEGWFPNSAYPDELPDLAHRDELPDLNQDNPAVAQYLIQNNVWWIETTGLDGLRFDTFPYVPRKFWSDQNQILSAEYPHLTTVGEVSLSRADPTVTAFFVGGHQIDGIDTGVSTVFDFPLYNALHSVIIQHEPVKKLAGIIARDWMYPHPEVLVTFLGNHDTPRFISRRDSSSGKLLAAFSLLITLRGIPQLYYGDELGMKGGEDPDNRHDFPVGFPADPKDTNQCGESAAPEYGKAIYDHVHDLLALRMAHPSLRRGRLLNIDYDDQHYIFLREDGNDKVLVVFNNDVMPHSYLLELTGPVLAKTKGIVKLSGRGTAELLEKTIHISEEPTSVTLYKLD